MASKVKLYAVSGWYDFGGLELVEVDATEQPKRYKLDKYTLPFGAVVPKENACLSPEAAVNEYVADAERMAKRLREQADEFDAKAKAASALLKGAK